MIREALLYEKLADSQVQCHLCHHRCRILPSYRGICGVRENRDGVLYTLVYGQVIAENIDPIEKKPLFHILPGHCVASRKIIGATMLWAYGTCVVASFQKLKSFLTQPLKPLPDTTQTRWTGNPFST